MNIGIIGTGNIASAVVTGFCKKGAGHTIFLSPRNAEKAVALAAKFSEVQVCAANQEVLDNSEWIFISLHKKDFDALNELTFREDHKVVNMAAEMRLPDLKSRIGETALLAHAIPLPMIANGYGPLIVYPEITEIGELFSPIGDVIYAENSSDTRTLQLVTCLMSPYYMLLHEVAKFTDTQNLDRDLSVNFLHSLFSSLSKRAAESPNCDLVELAHDMTPGGYNEQAMRELVSGGAIDMWGAALNRLMERLNSEQNLR